MKNRTNFRNTVETGVDPRLHSNHRDYGIERKFGSGWQDWRTPIGKAYCLLNFQLYNLAHRWMWEKASPGDIVNTTFLERSKMKKKEKIDEQTKQYYYNNKQWKFRITVFSNFQKRVAIVSSSDDFFSNASLNVQNSCPYGLCFA